MEAEEGRRKRGGVSYFSSSFETRGVKIEIYLEGKSVIIWRPRCLDGGDRVKATPLLNGRPRENLFNGLLKVFFFASLVEEGEDN